MKHKLLFLSLLAIIWSSSDLFAQNKPKIEEVLKNQEFQMAYRLLNKRLVQLIAEKETDSLVEYIFLAGKVAEQSHSVEKSIKDIKSVLRYIKQFTNSNGILSQSYLNAGEFYGYIGKNQLAYDANKEALKYETASGDINMEKLSLIERNLGEYARRLGNPNLSEIHLRKAVSLTLSSKSANNEQLYLAYTAMASMMWYSSRTDSAKYYFQKAIDAVHKIDTTPINKYYRTAILNNNIAGIYSLEGKATDAIKAMETAIDCTKKFIVSKGYEEKKKSAVALQFEALDNLAGIYKGLGNYSRAQNLLEYSYQQKRKNLPPSDPAIFISKILLGQLYYATNDFEKALSFLYSGQEALHKESGTYLFWDADACYTIALILDRVKKYSRANTYYKNANSLYAAAFQGNHDEIYLDFLRNYSLFDAENGRCDQAIKRSHTTLNYVLINNNSNSLIKVYQLSNLSEIYAQCNNYTMSLEYAQKAIDNIHSYIKQSASFLDSVKIEAEMPKAILLQSKAKYKLLKNRDTGSIATILNDLSFATDIIERKKTIFSDVQDIAAFIESQKEITDFIKHLNYELYKLSFNKSYIDKIIGVHEAALYSRIRSRMDRQKAIRFANLPDSVIAREAMLQKQMKTALQNKKADDNVLIYLQSVKNWEAFQQQLKTQYPRYYKMRYGSSDVSLKGLCKYIPEGVHVVRYIFSNEELLAVIASREKQVLVPLSSKNLKEKILALNDAANDPVQTGKLAAALYDQLWKPLEKHIAGNRVMIIPDDVLYNLSFEMLTPVTTTDFAALSKKCLLNKYAVSYQYSLLALTMEKRNETMKGNFVAFTPGFSEKNKNQYLRFAKNDSLHLDKKYLSLLPLPFTTDLVKKLKDKLGGKLFSENESTPEMFRKEAGNHRIIHIGTHAESDNDHPEYSRLIFAKDDKNVNAENSVYLYDIYDCDLTSDLAVLTACESGRPGYQDGEGMVSMAHAFSYAGSESIMTGLWKIDEQSSMQITEAFYENLQKGMTKDKALQQAKLHYLKNARGRMLAPQYWAGLVIMGDISAVELESTILPKLIVISGVIVLMIAGYYFLRKKKITYAG